MANILGSLFVELKAETASFVSGMSKASYAAKQASKDISSAFSQLGGVVQSALAPFGEFGSVIGQSLSGATEAFSGMASAGSGAAFAIGGIGAAAVAAAAGVAALAISGAGVIEKFHNLSEETGLSVRDLQALKFAGDSTGVSLDSLVTGFRKFDQGISGVGVASKLARTVLDQLGVTSHDTKEALLQTADAFSKMPDGPRKVAEAVALFGRSGMDLIPILDQGRAGVESFYASVDKYGINVGGNAVQATERWRTSVAQLSSAWDGFKVAMSPVLDLLSKLVTKVADFTMGLQHLKSASLELGRLAIAPITGGVFGVVDHPQSQRTPADDQADKKKEDTARQQDALNEKLRQQFEIAQAGSVEVYALEQKRKELTDAVNAGLYQQAISIQKQVQSLQAAVDKENALNESFLKIDRELAAGPPKPKAAHIEKIDLPDISDLIPSGISDQAKATQDALNAASEQEISTREAAQAQIQTILSKDIQSEITIKNQGYQVEQSQLYDSLQQGLITQQQYYDASAALAREMQGQLGKLGEEWDKWDKQMLKTGDLSQKFGAMLDQMRIAGQNFGATVFEAFSQSIEGVEDQLAKLLVTGKANFKQIQTQLEESLVKGGIQKAVGTVSGGFENMLGIGPKSQGKKPVGTVDDPIYVAMAKKADALGALNTGQIGIPGVPPPGSPSSLPSMMSKMLGSFGSIFGKLGSLFGGFLAGGGDVTPGKAYIVGEKHPEFFAPKSAGTVAPTMRFSGGHVTNMSVNFHGVADADSFKKSQGQILAAIHQQASVAYARQR